MDSSTFSDDITNLNRLTFDLILPETPKPSSNNHHLMFCSGKTAPKVDKL